MVQDPNGTWKFKANKLSKVYKGYLGFKAYREHLQNVDFIAESGFLGYNFYARMCCKTHQKSTEILNKYENYEKARVFSFGAQN